MSLSEDGRIALLRSELASCRLLFTPFAAYSDETSSELEIVKAAAEAHVRYGTASIQNYVISKAEQVSDLLEVCVLLKEAGLLRPGDPPSTVIMPVPLFETIADLERAPEVNAVLARYTGGRRDTAFTDCKDQQLLREMWECWPFFRTTIDNMEMVLAKSDMTIAGRYLELVEDKRAGRQISERIRDEWQRAHDGLLAITGENRLLEANPRLDNAIRLRLPYIEPLNELQVELLKRFRGGGTDQQVREGIQLTINAIATALRNSG